MSFVLMALPLVLQPQGPTVCALTGVELPTSSAICPYTGEPAAATAPPPTLMLDFETSAEPLQALAGAKTELRSDGAKSGASYLHVDCRGITPGQDGTPAGVALMGPPHPTGSLAFWARSATPHVFAVMVLEEDQSAYFTAGFLPPGRWQRIVIDLQDMAPAPESAPDENGRLDLDQVGTIVLCDPQGFDKGAAAPSTLELDLDALTIRPDAVRRKPATQGDGILLGDFGISAYGWFPMGSGDFDIVELADEPGARAAHVATTDPTNFSAWFGILSAFAAKRAWLSFEVTARAEFPCTLAMLASEDSGGDYWQAGQITEAGVWQLLVFRADGFSPSGDKPDTVNGKLDTERVLAVGLAVPPSEPGAAPWRNVVDIRRVVEIPLGAPPDAGDPFR